MMHRKIAGPILITANDMTGTKIELSPSKGGSRFKTLQYWINVIQTSGDDVDISMDVEHGPDGLLFTTLASNVIQETITGLSAVVYAGATGQDEGSSTKVVGEYFRPSITLKRAASSGDISAMIEVYETRKPF